MLSLGWDVHNPSQVRPEEVDSKRKDKSKPDYALYCKLKDEENPDFVVEAKKTSVDFQNWHITRYSTRAPRILWTNGDIWILGYLAFGEFHYCWKVSLTSNSWSEVSSCFETIRRDNILKLTPARMKIMSKEFSEIHGEKLWEEQWEKAMQDREFQARFVLAPKNTQAKASLFSEFAKHVKTATNGKVKAFVRKKLGAATPKVQATPVNTESPKRIKTVVICGTRQEVKSAREAFETSVEWLIRDGKLDMSLKTTRGVPIFKLSGVSFRLAGKLSNGYFYESNASTERLHGLAKYMFKSCGYSEKDINFS